MRIGSTVALSSLVLAAGLLASPAARAGDSLYGVVAEVTSPVSVTLDTGADKVDLRLLGIEPPADQKTAQAATKMLTGLVYRKTARARIEFRNEAGEMNAVLYTDDSVNGIKNVAVELVRAGLARVAETDEPADKYGELDAAQAEARKTRRGLWATSRSN